MRIPTIEKQRENKTGDLPLEWRTFKLKDITTLITKGTTPSTIGKRFVSEGINYIKSEAVSYSGSIDRSTFVYIDEDTHKKLKRSQLEDGDILFSMAGIFLGKTGIVSKDMLPANTNQALAIIRANKELVLPTFLYYFLRQPSVIKYVNGLSAQSAQPNINLEEIGDLNISVPSLRDQEIIAETLLSLDQKIDLNHKLNKTLESIADSCFKEKFIGLKNIPNSWKVSKIGEELSTYLGGTPSREKIEYWENGTVPWINSGKVNEFRITEPSEYISDEALKNSAAKLLPQGTTVIAITGATLGQYSLLEISSSFNQSVVGIKEGDVLKKEFIYLWIANTIKDLINSQTGGAQQHINKQVVDNHPILVPDHETLQNYYKITQPIFELISIGCFEINNLSRVRDGILSRLMQGRHKIK